MQEGLAEKKSWLKGTPFFILKLIPSYQSHFLLGENPPKGYIWLYVALIKEFCLISIIWLLVSILNIMPFMADINQYDQ